jgi:hypothetical protein
LQELTFYGISECHTKYATSNLGLILHWSTLISTNPLGLAQWGWLGTLECAPLKGLRFYPPWCHFRWVSPYRAKKLALNGASVSGQWDWSLRISVKIKNPHIP